VLLGAQCQNDSAAENTAAAQSKRGVPVVLVRSGFGEFCRFRQK